MASPWARAAAAVVACLVATSSLPLMANALDAPSAPASERIEEFKVRLINITATYERESWKNSADFYVRGPVNGFTNGSSQFDSALGYHVILRVGLTDLQGKPITASQDIQNVELAAYLDAPRGPREAWIVRAPGPAPGPVVGQLSSTSPEYFLHFDMDGSNTAPPGGRAPLSFNPGSQIVHVTVNRRGATGAVERVGGNDLLFAYGNVPQSLAISGVASPLTTVAPDSMFRHLTDIGKDDRVLFVQEPVTKTSNLTLTYSFGKTNATVRLYAFAAHRGPCDAPGGVGSPNCGPLLVYRRLHRTGTTDGAGMVTFQAGAAELLQFSSRTFGAAVVVLAAALEPQDPSNPTLGSEFAAGSPTLLTAATETVIPITDRSSRISKYSIDTRAYENATTAPDPVRQLILNANYLEVQIYQDASDVTEGDARAFVPGSGSVLASGAIGSHQDPTFQNYRVARLPVSGIQGSGASHYRIVGFLYHRNGGEFQGLAWGDRGYTASFSLPTTNIQASGKAWINLTSINTNYDGVPNEPGFQLKVILRVAIPELQTNRTVTIDVPEGGTVSHTQAVSSSRPGEVRITFVGTTGDTLKEWRQTMTFINPPPPKGIADRIPGFEGLFAAMAFAVVGFALWRRGRTGEGF